MGGGGEGGGGTGGGDGGGGEGGGGGDGSGGRGDGGGGGEGSGGDGNGGGGDCSACAAQIELRVRNSRATNASVLLIRKDGIAQFRRDELGLDAD